MDSQEQKDIKIAEYYMQIAEDLMKCNADILDLVNFFHSEARNILNKWPPIDEAEQKEDL